jgi:hypothetical protein
MWPAFFIFVVLAFAIGGYTYHRMRRRLDPLEEAHQDALGNRRSPSGEGFAGPSGAG